MPLFPWGGLSSAGPIVQSTAGGVLRCSPLHDGCSRLIAGRSGCCGTVQRLQEGLWVRGVVGSESGRSEATGEAQARSAALAAPWGDGPGRRSWGGYGRFFGFQSILST